MLDLQRASAGSGKTYTLAKKYIWYLLTIVPEGETSERLRTDAELADAAPHILAVTFTNKATNEMQMRIVDKLHALSSPSGHYAPGGDREGKLPDYMEEFCDRLGVDSTSLAKAAGTALAALLGSYSDFNVSTIDSFFQKVLRTFAYETGLNDAYQVELDAKYLSEVSVDAVLEDVDQNYETSKASFWIRMLMDRTEHGRWNIFQRKEGADSPYGDFLKVLNRLENEEYKQIRDRIEGYFNDNGDFETLFGQLCGRFETPVREAFEALSASARDLHTALPEELRSASANSHLGRPGAPWRALSPAGRPAFRWDVPPEKPKSGTDHRTKFRPEYFDTPKLRKWYGDNPGAAGNIQSLIEGVCSAFARWENLACAPAFRHWRLYARYLPYLGLFGIAAKMRKQYLDETNSVELGETAMILQGVIGDDDAPFVYERLGTKINHFLIDEFQDTSRMQWTVMKPLLSESMGRGHDNLIIGDAKQSIYRFRNADPSLISRIVPETYRGRVNMLGEGRAENTNWRSSLRVVQTNNSFFRWLTARLDEQTGGEAMGRTGFKALYSNVVQHPRHNEERGYVELAWAKCSGEQWDGELTRRLPALVADLRARGYAWRDIAVLTRTNREAEAVIAAFSSANESGEWPEKIPYVSEQSLKVSASRAVSVIVSVLESIATGASPEIRTGEEREQKGVADWRDLMAGFRHFALRTPGLGHAELLDLYLERGNDTDALRDMLAKMQSLALPALVEAVAASFLPEDDRNRDAIYLAAFQDLVLEYCESKPTDISSFLSWWERKKETAAVSSPEGTDAVQVMTVHKSKGLEFKCVVLPFTNWDLRDTVPANKSEWRWVVPSEAIGTDTGLPPFVPVEITDRLRGTEHESALTTFHDMVKMDFLNQAYVAMTRAVDELYVFAVENSRTGSETVGLLFRDWLTGGVEIPAEGETGLLPPTAVEIKSSSEEGGVVAAGIKPDSTTTKAPPEVRRLEGYGSVATPAFLTYRTEGLPSGLAEAEEAEDLDPRSEGTLKHAVLELVETAADLPAAVRHLCLAGLIPEAMAPGIEDSLASELADPNVAWWFDGTAKVIAERSILDHGKVLGRPDRLMVWPDGHAVVVDYKFGAYHKGNDYRRQVSRYVTALRKTGRYTTVTGYLWYVNARRIDLV